MKKLFLLCTLFIAISPAIAQYNFVNTTSTYQALTGAADATGGMLWDDDEFNIPIGFSMNAFGRSYDSLVIESNGSFFLHKGLMFNSIYSTQDTFPAISAYNDDLLYKTSGSPILYKVTGTPGSRLLTVEFKNAGFYNDGSTGTYYVNFQLRLFESTGTIEIVYGPSNVPAGNYLPSVALVWADMVNYTEIMPMYLDGSATNPTVVTNYSTLTSMPENGRTYRFNDIFLSAGKTISADSQYKVFPIPASENLNIEIPSEEAGTLNLIDITGKLVRSAYCKSGVVNTMNVQDLAPGVYFIKFPSGNTSRVVIQ